MRHPELTPKNGIISPYPSVFEPEPIAGIHPCTPYCTFSFRVSVTQMTGGQPAQGCLHSHTLRRSTAAYRTSLAHIPTRKQQTHRCSLDVQPLSVGLPFQTLPVRAVLSSENIKRDARLLHKSLITEQYFFEIPEQILSSIRSSLCVQESPTSGGIALTKFEKHSTVYIATIERPAYGCLTCVRR